MEGEPILPQYCPFHSPGQQTALKKLGREPRPLPGTAPAAVRAHCSRLFDAAVPLCTFGLAGARIPPHQQFPCHGRAERLWNVTAAEYPHAPAAVARLHCATTLSRSVIVGRVARQSTVHMHGEE